jgi:hypothetical protein
MNLLSRLKKAEQATQRAGTAEQGQECSCKVKNFYFTVEGMTPEEVEKELPGNRQNCPTCGRRNMVIHFSSPQDLKG